MSEFESYFSDDEIIKLLCRYRIKIALERHKLHLLADVSSSKKVLKDFKERASVPIELSELLPRRRQWYRPNANERKKFSDPQKLNEFALIKSIQIQKKKVNNLGTAKPEWLIQLDDFIKSIKDRAKNPALSELQKPRIIPVRKEKSQQCLECRPISAYERIEDRIILSITARYFTQKFDHGFLDCSYAFRAVKTAESGRLVRTHHDTIQRIVQYLSAKKSQSIYVAECDLQKFFDSINHEVILKSLESLSSSSNIQIDDSAKKIFQQYLDSYSFSQTVFPLNNTDFFDGFKMPGANFPWVEDELVNKFYPDDKKRNDGRLENNQIGIPQGGAISTFISNLVLHFVDQKVYQGANDDLLYLRFCDDMVLFHTNKDECQAALDRYLNEMNQLKLLTHEPKEVGGYSKDFWTKSSKSKKPYPWGSPNEMKTNIPYVAFVGYQIRYDGLIRIRKKSIVKELKKQREECNAIIESLRSYGNGMNELSKGSRGQQVFAILNRLISMSVGRIRLFDLTGKQSLCWANGFKGLSLNTSTNFQLKMLDRARRANLRRITKKLNDITKPATKVDPNTEITTKYFGAPFSYFGIQHKK